MSAPVKYGTIEAALVDWRAGKCRRWVEVGGFQRDLAREEDSRAMARTEAIAGPVEASAAPCPTACPVCGRAR